MSILDKIAPTPGNLVQGLLVLQSQAGYLSDEAVAEAARYFHVPQSEVERAVAFYGALKRRKPGKRHFVLCRGRLCRRKHADELETLLLAAARRDPEITVEYADCLGVCSAGPALRLNGKLHKQMTPAKLQKLLRPAVTP